MVSSILRDQEERGSGFRASIADQIEKDLSIELRGGKVGKPDKWTLFRERVETVDGKRNWNKSKIAGHDYTKKDA